MSAVSQALHPGRANGRLRDTPWLLTGIAALVSVAILAPLAMTIADAFGGSLAAAVNLLLRPIVARLLLNTIGIALGTTLIAAVVGTATAWLIERTDLPGRRWWSILVPLPLAIPAFIASYAWLSTSTVFEGAAGALMVVSVSYYPLVYLPVAAALRGMDPALEESARTLGCSPWRCFFRVILPELRPALLGGMLLVVLHVLAEFGAFALLRFRTFTTVIYAEYTAGFATDQGAMLACVLLALCLGFLWLEARLRGHHAYARVGTGTRRPPIRYALGRTRLPACAGMVALAVVALGVPIAVILFWLTRHDAAAVSTTAVSGAALLHATLHSFGYGLAAGIATTLAALPIAWLSVRRRGWFVDLMERATYLPRGMPGIVVALALVALSLRFAYPLYQGTVLLIAAYAILYLPLALVSAQASLTQVPRTLEQAARVLGAGPAGVFRRVLLPLAAPGLGAAAALVFLSTCTELTSTLLLIPTGAQTLATQVWAAGSTFAFASAAPYAAILVGISMFATWLLADRFGRTPVEVPAHA